MSSKINQNMDDHSLSGFCIRATAARGGGGGGAGTKCGRWNPTTEQVKVLTELFRSGLRTPSTDQIQKIASQLSLYGKIESKNVFYWFQNHKARERQKRRRRVLLDEESHVLDPHEHHIDPNKVSSNKPVGVREMNQLIRSDSADRVVETLQLFPLNSLSETDDSENLRLFAEGCNEDNYSLPETYYDYCNKIGGTEVEIIPTLDLRLSSFI